MGKQPLIDRRAGWLIAFALVATVGWFTGESLRWGRRPNATMEKFIALVHAAKDEEVLTLMSQRYRNGHTLSDLRAALAELSELRSATGITPLQSASQQRFPDPFSYCAQLDGVYPPAFTRASLVWEGRRWHVDGLAIEKRQLDPARPVARKVCGPARGIPQ